MNIKNKPAKLGVNDKLNIKGKPEDIIKVLFSKPIKAPIKPKTKKA